MLSHATPNIDFFVEMCIIIVGLFTYINNKGLSEMGLKDFLVKPPVKSIIIALLTTALSICTALLGDWSVSQANFGWKLTGFIVCVAVYVVALALYATNEANLRKACEVLQRQVNTFEDLVISIISICETNASDVNTCIHRALDTKEIDLGVWCFEKACRSLCQNIYDNICKLGNSKKYGIAYVKLVEGDGAEDKVEMIAYANQNRHKPSIFGIKRKFKGIDKSSAYHDLCLFDEAKSDNRIYMRASEVDGVFVRNKGKHHLYIGIPVFCDSKKMIGLLEVVGLDDSMLGCTSREELDEATNKFLVPYANVFLLLHKMEKALLVGTSKK